MDTPFAAKPRVLVVDDEPNMTELFRMMLEMEGYAVDIATDVEGALLSLDRQLPDVILLDIMLQGPSGLDLCRMLRDDPERADIPIVILSAKSQLEDVQQGMEAGARQYLLKPISKNELVEAVARAIRAA